MNDKKLLREWYPIEYTPELLKERKEKDGGKIFINGVIQRADAKNQNGRIYPKNILQREVENYLKAVREGRAMGELDHPESSTVSLKNVSHVLREVWWDGNDVKGRAEVLSTPSGKVLENLLEAGVMLGISSRGVGSTEKRRMAEGDADVVNDDFQIICWDMVSEPSTQKAYMFKEGLSIDLDPRRTWTKADRIYRALNEITRK
jgi:hypothetical protein